MTPDQIIRWTWTLLTGGGVLFAAWNFREVLIDSFAVSQVRRAGTDVLRMQTNGAVYDHGLIMVALALDFVAGVGAIAGAPLIPLVALVLQALALILLSISTTDRRRRVLRALKMRSTKGKVPTKEKPVDLRSG